MLLPLALFGRHGLLPTRGSPTARRLAVVEPRRGACTSAGAIAAEVDAVLANILAAI